MYTKEELLAMGLSQEFVTKILNDQASKKEFFIPKDRFNAVSDELKTAKATIKERDNQITELKKFEGTNAELQTKLTTIEADNAKKIKEYEDAANETNKLTAIKLALLGDKESKPYDVDMVLGLLDHKKITLGTDGKLKDGLTDQLTALRKDKPFLWEPADKGTNDEFKFFGFKPGDGKPAGTEKTPAENSTAFGKYLAEGKLSMMGIVPKQKEE